MSDPKIAFELRTVRLPLADILPVKQYKNPEDNIRRYRTIRDSIKVQGLVEPLVVYPVNGSGKHFYLLDGHLRLIALQALGQTEADCIISKDDEAFTYNARISRVSPIQEHKMILKAVNSGVSPERIAAALNLSTKYVEAALTLLDGINPAAAELLKEKPVAPKAISSMKKVQPLRQIEMAELMVASNTYTSSYADALVLASPRDQLLNPKESKRRKGLKPEQIAKMEEEMQLLERDLKALEESYGENMLNLTLARGYIQKLVENAKVTRYLSAHFSEILGEFERITAAEAV